MRGSYSVDSSQRQTLHDPTNIYLTVWLPLLSSRWDVCLKVSVLWLSRVSSTTYSILPSFITLPGAKSTFNYLKDSHQLILLSENLELPKSYCETDQDDHP